MNRTSRLNRKTRSLSPESQTMKLRLLVLLLLLAAGPLWSQVEPSATGGVATPEDDERMALPPPVSGQAYPTAVGAEERSNFLSGGITVTASHNDNIEPGQSSAPISDWIYSILPTIKLNQTMPRQRRELDYSAGFVIYDPTSALNTAQQNAAASYQYRLSPRATFSARDNFSQSSNAFNSGTAGAGPGVSGSSPGPEVAVITPYAEQITNGASVDLSYQYGRDGMIGGSGSTVLLDYPNPSETEGLYNFISEGGSGFMIRRFLGTQYIGGVYKFYRVVTSGGGSTTRTDTISLFYTVYLNRTLSISFSGGPQHYDAEYAGAPTQSAWTPAGTASIGWQRKRTNFNASYSRTVTGGGGLLGTYDASSVAGSLRWLVARNWTLAATGNYFISKNATSIQYSSFPTGHNVYGTIALQRMLGQHMNAQVGYSRLHQSYNYVTSVVNHPDSNGVFVSFSYLFTKPLGR